MPTHYENLNVSETAPDEVIRAAYMALASKCNSDLDKVENRRLILTLTESYEALSTPQRRSKYDASLKLFRSSMPQRSRNSPIPRSLDPEYIGTETTMRRGLLIRAFTYIFSDFWRGLLFITACFLVILALPLRDSESRSTTIKPITNIRTHPSVTRPQWVRPSLSPVGTYWPSNAGYVAGYDIQAQGGLSSVTIDNGRNSSDVFLKLVWLSKMEAIPARMCYIPAHSSFTFTSVMPGIYDVRYRDLSTGGLSKTEEFVLQERQDSSGTNFSNITLTLYKVVNGNMETEAIEESEF